MIDKIIKECSNINIDEFASRYRERYDILCGFITKWTFDDEHVTISIDMPCLHTKECGAVIAFKLEDEKIFVLDSDTF